MENIPRLLLSDLELAVEIEGAFSTELAELVDVNKWGTWADDGSVDHDLIDELDYPIDAEEFRSGVVGYKKLYKILRAFSKPNYASNDSCGIHLHISAKDCSPKILARIVSDLDFMEHIRDVARNNFGEEQSRRLGEDNEYCQFFKGSGDLSHCIRNRDKYRFMRYHPSYNTLEWRFFSALENGNDNVDNIRLFLKEFLKHINGCRTIKNITEIEVNDEEQVVKSFELNLGKGFSPSGRVVELEHSFKASGHYVNMDIPFYVMAKKE